MVTASDTTAADLIGGEAWRGGWWQLVEQRATRTPDRRLLFDDRGRSLTCRQYRDAAERVAAGLWERGIRPDSSISWQLPTSLEAAVLLAAVTRLGATQNLLMPILRDRELNAILGQLRPELLVVPVTWRNYDHRALGQRLAARHGCELLAVDFDGRAGDELALPQADPAVLDGVPAPSNSQDRAVRWVFYSSGTTGSPKGVKHSDASVISASGGSIFCLHVSGADVLSITYPITHIGGPSQLAITLRVGASLFLVETFDVQRSPLELSRAGVTQLGSATPFFLAYLEAQRQHGPEPLFPRLRISINGGASAAPGLHERVYRELGGVGLFNGYGCTECPITGYAGLDSPPEFLATGALRSAPGVQVRVVGNEERELPPGQQGELRLRGPQLFAGYVDASLDADALDDQGFLKTGDLGVIAADGSYRVTGRLKDIIIRNAENISAPQLEAVLGRHPHIAEVAAVGLPDPRTGERCCAFVVPTDADNPPELPDIVAFCHSQAVAAYTIPEQLEIVSTLPKNAMGKVLKHELRRQYARATSH